MAARAVDLIGWAGSLKGDLTSAAIVRNLTIVERLGTTTYADIEEMSRGRAATVRVGPYVGEILSVDHIIPHAVTPEIDNVIANLELMPLSVNQKKGDSVTSRQADLARKLKAAGLLSDEGLEKTLAARKE